MTNISTLEAVQADNWKDLVAIGLKNSVSGLAGMVNQEIEVGSLRAKRINIAEAANLLGGPETPTAAIYLTVTGSATGHLVVVYNPETAYQLVDMVMGDPVGTTSAFGEMEISVLGEVGNVMGAFFLSALADHTGLDLRVSPPAVMMDMAGAILDAALSEIAMETDQALVVETDFGTTDRQMAGTFLVMPSPDLQQVLLSAVGS